MASSNGGGPAPGAGVAVIRRRGARLVGIAVAAAAASVVVMAAIYATVHTAAPGSRLQMWSLTLFVITVASTVAVGLHVMRPAWQDLSEEVGAIERESLLRRRELEEELARAERYAHELERSVEDLRSFASVASHDLKEPIRSVVSHLQLLKRQQDGALDEAAQERIDTAIDAALRMDDLVSGLSTYTQAGAGGEPFEAVDLEEVVEAARDNLHTRIRETDARIEVEPLPEVYGDRSQLVQVFQNLLANSLKFAGEEPPRVRIEASEAGDMCEIAVVDEGMGFDADSEGRIFEMFQRGDTDEPGTGVGLAVCERIVKRHHGEIDAESRPGEGARFSFTLLPVDEGEEPPDPVEPHTSGRTIRERSQELI